MQHRDRSICHVSQGVLGAFALVALGAFAGACDKSKKPTTPAARRAAGSEAPGGARATSTAASREGGSGSAREGGAASAREGGSAPAREGGSAPAREIGTSPAREIGATPARPAEPKAPAGPKVLTEAELRRLLGAGKYDEVIREAKRALEENERSVPAMAVMAEAYFHKKDYELCRAVLDSINDQQKEHPLYLYLQGRIFLHEKNFALAQSFFEKAVQKNPMLLDAWTVIGVRRLQGGNYKNALDALLRAKALPGGNTYAMNLNLGSCYRGLAHQGGGKEQLVTALNYYVEAEKRYQMEPASRGKPYPKAIFNKAILYLDAPQFPGLNTIQRLERGILYLEQYVTLMPRVQPRTWAKERTEILKILTKAKNVDLPAAKAMAQAKAAQPARPTPPPREAVREPPPPPTRAAPPPRTSAPVEPPPR